MWLAVELAFFNDILSADLLPLAMIMDVGEPKLRVIEAPSKIKRLAGRPGGPSTSADSGYASYYEVLADARHRPSIMEKESQETRSVNPSCLTEKSFVERVFGPCIVSDRQHSASLRSTALTELTTLN
jgi:hypothetical protein